MGWSFHHGTGKADIIADVVRNFTFEKPEGSCKVLAKCIRGNTMYMVVEIKKAGAEPERFIDVVLLSRGKDGYGYKDMDDGMHPYSYDCPIGYLDMCTAPMNKGAADYREKVRERHAVHGRKLSIGDKVKLTNGWVVEIVSLKPLKCRFDGLVYKFSRKSLAPAEVAAA